MPVLMRFNVAAGARSPRPGYAPLLVGFFSGVVTSSYAALTPSSRPQRNLKTQDRPTASISHMGYAVLDMARQLQPPSAPSGAYVARSAYGLIGASLYFFLGGAHLRPPPTPPADLDEYGRRGPERLLKMFALWDVCFACASAGPLRAMSDCFRLGANGVCGASSPSEPTSLSLPHPSWQAWPAVAG